MSEPIGSFENPCTLENSPNPQSRGGKYCRCDRCGIVRLCTPACDFFGNKEQGDKELICEPCLDTHLRAEGLEVREPPDPGWHRPR